MPLQNFARYEMMNREVCNKLTTYATERRLYAFGAGWLFGAGVPAATRRRIDKGILDLRMTDEMRGLLDPHDGKTCKPSRPDIDADIVGVAILILVGPSVIMLTVIMCVVRMKDSGPEARDDWVFILRGRGRDVSIG